jgi:pectin methylesterase-like acyl-CoA thioesterase
LVATIRWQQREQPGYVDDDNAGFEDGSQANPYNTITEAVNAADDGDIIMVANGNYNENVNILKSLTIRSNKWRGGNIYRCK